MGMNIAPITILLENSVTPAVIRQRISIISHRGRCDKLDNPPPMAADRPDFYKDSMSNSEQHPAEAENHCNEINHLINFSH